MYSLFNPELVAVAKQVHDEQLDYETGGCTARFVATVQRERFNAVVD
jgi:hypothetical protein